MFLDFDNEGHMSAMNDGLYKCLLFDVETYDKIKMQHLIKTSQLIRYKKSK